MSDLEELREHINICYSKLQFIADVFDQTKCLKLTERSQAGLSHIVDDITESIGYASDGIEVAISNDKK